jgi:hypothetical protein
MMYRHVLLHGDSNLSRWNKSESTFTPWFSRLRTHGVETRPSRTWDFSFQRPGIGHTVCVHKLSNHCRPRSNHPTAWNTARYPFLHCPPQACSATGSHGGCGVVSAQTSTCVHPASMYQFPFTGYPHITIERFVGPQLV